MNTWLFPLEKREFAGKRHLMTGLRTLHLIGVCGYAGFFLFGLETQQWAYFAVLALVSGLAMLLLEVWADGIFLLQMRGLAVLLKLAILLWILVDPSWRIEGFLCIVILAGYFSHAPARVRYYLPFTGLNASSSRKLREIQR